MEKSFLWGPSGFYSWAIVVSDIYINDLPFILERYSFPVIVADNMSVVITETNGIDFLMNSKEIFSQINGFLQIGYHLIMIKQISYILEPKIHHFWIPNENTILNLLI
jgi:hypothetical protein